MEFKCFIKLLEEKKYITETGRFKDMSIDYECKYEEVTDKIIAEIEERHKTDDDYIHNIQYQIINNGIKIVFVNETKKQISNMLNGEEKDIKESEIGYINLNRLLQNDENYDVSWNDMWNYYTIIDLKVRKEREDKERKEKEECLEFLKQLP